MLSVVHLAKLMANNGSWMLSISRCCAMIDCIFMRLLVVACCWVMVSTGDSSWLHSRDCTDSRNSVYKLFLSASVNATTPIKIMKALIYEKHTKTLTPTWSLQLFRVLAVQVPEQLHGFPSHYDLLEDRFEEGHHGELPVAGALIPSGAAAGRIV